MARNPYFKSIPDWKDAKDHIDFEPRVPSFTAGYALSSLSIHVMDHRRRQLPVSRRSLEAHYNQAFVIDQKRLATVNEARKAALSTFYGPTAQTILIATHEGRSYELGPEVSYSAPDGRVPAIVVWHEDDLLFLIASTQLEANVLSKIATSMYA